MTVDRLRTGVAYFGNRFPAHARADLARIAPVCDYVVHTVSETDFYFHKRALERIVDETRRAGLETWVDPWGLGGVFGGESFSKFLLDRPATWQVLSDGRRVPAACLRRREFRDFLREWLDVVRALGAQTIFWDEPHVYFHWDLEWEGIYGCVCEMCRDVFRREHGRDLPLRLDEDAKAFRRETLAGFLQEMVREARDRGMKSALCLYAIEGYAEYDRVWDRLAGLEGLSVFGTDPYWRWRPTHPDPAAHVAHYTRKAARAAAPHGAGVQVWVQAMRLPSGAEGEIETACRAAVSAGATHLAAWSYDGGALLDPVLSENPERVWEETARVFSALRRPTSP